MDRRDGENARVSGPDALGARTLRIDLPIEK
jgi:hypothetical protein